MLQRFKKIQRVLIYVLFLNLAVAFAKIIYGNLTGTLSMIADGYHSLFDGVSNIIGLAGSFIASRPPDSDASLRAPEIRNRSLYFYRLTADLCGR